MSLFQQGFRAEEYWGSELTATHLPKKSIYRFKENPEIRIIHTCDKIDGEFIDGFAVTYLRITATHPNGNMLAQDCKTIGNFDKFLDAYYCGVQCINNLNQDYENEALKA